MVLAIALPLLVALIVGRYAWYYLVGEGAGNREELHNRLIGEWHVDLEGEPRSSITLKIDDDGLTMINESTITRRHDAGRWKYEVVGHWREQVTIRTTTNEGHALEWRFNFKGDNEVLWADLTEKKRTHVLGRLGTKAPPLAERQRLAEKHRAALVGKWRSPLSHAELKEIVLEFGPDGSVQADYVYLLREAPDTVKGKCRFVWADEKTARLVVEGCENHFTRLNIEFQDGGGLGVTMKGDMGVLEMAASRPE
jgi:hypothetical protein